MIDKPSSNETKLSELNLEMKLMEIDRKVDRILEASSMSINSKKDLKRHHEKKLFDVDINLNISTDGQSTVQTNARKNVKESVE